MMWGGIWRMDMEEKIKLGGLEMIISVNVTLTIVHKSESDGQRS